MHALRLVSRLLRRLGLVAPAADFPGVLEAALRCTDPVTLRLSALERAVSDDPGAGCAGRPHPSQED